MRDEINTCEVIQDLLPLYEDNCCSSQSRALVEAHLQECESCREIRAAYQRELPEKNGQEEEEVRGIRRGIRIFVRWRTIGISFLCIILIAVFIILPVWNYRRGYGLTYANLGAVCTAYAFERALASGDYEKAYGYLDIEFQYEELTATEQMWSPNPEDQKDAEAVAAGICEVEEKGFSWYNEVCRDAFFQNMQTLEAQNETIRSCSDLRVENEGNRWGVRLNVRTGAGTDLILWMDIAGNRIRNVSASLNRRDVSSRTPDQTEEGSGEGKMYEVLYRTPSINENVMEILYEDTSYDWTMLFDY